MKPSAASATLSSRNRSQKSWNGVLPAIEPPACGGAPSDHASKAGSAVVVNGAPYIHAARPAGRGRSCEETIPRTLGPGWQADGPILRSADA
jgi:hypothetical protein